MKFKVDAAGIRCRARRGAGKLTGAAALIAAVLAGQEASAQIAPGRSGTSSTMTITDNEEAFRTLNAFANCYARQNTARALELIATEPGTTAEAETYRRLFRRDNMSCLGEATELFMPMALVRGAIAEGLYKRGVALPPNLVQAAPEPGTVRTLSDAARCYTAAHRDRVRALVEQTPPGSRREFAALTEMAADFFQCVPEAGRNRQFNPTQLRFRLAEALLRMPAPAN